MNRNTYNTLLEQLSNLNFENIHTIKNTELATKYLMLLDSYNNERDVNGLSISYSSKEGYIDEKAKLLILEGLYLKGYIIKE